jgi:hypothetical protein
VICWYLTTDGTCSHSLGCKLVRSLLFKIEDRLYNSPSKN